MSRRKGLSFVGLHGLGSGDPLAGGGTRNGRPVKGAAVVVRSEKCRDLLLTGVTGRG